MSALGSLVVKLALEYAQFTQGLNKTEQEALNNAEKVQKAYDKMAGAVDERFKSLKSSIAGAVAGAISVAGLIAVGQKIRAETVNAEKEQAQLAAALKSTGEAAGWSQDQLNDMAAAMNKVTTYSAGEINQAQARLLAYVNITGEQVPRAVRAAMDMGTRLEMNLNQSMETVAKALDKPSTGMQSLQRQGFKFTESQIEMAKALENSGRLADAQAIVFAELESSYGGAAEAARDTLGGALTAVSNTINDLLTADSASLPGLRNSVEDLNTTLSSDETRAAFQTFVGWIVSTGAAAARSAANLVTFLNIVRNADPQSNATQNANNLQGRSKYLLSQAELFTQLSEADPGNKNYQAQLANVRAELDQVSLAMGKTSDQLKGLAGDTGKAAATTAEVTQALETQGSVAGRTDAYLKEFGTSAQKAAIKIAEMKAKLGDAFTPEMEAKIRAVYAAQDKGGRSAVQSAKQLQTAYDSTAKTLDEKIASQRLELATSEKLKDSAKLRIKFEQDLKGSLSGLNEASRANIELRLKTIETLEEEIEAQQKLAKMAEEERAYRQEWWSLQAKTVEELEASNKSLSEEVELIGRSAQEQAILLQQREQAILLTKEQRLAEMQRVEDAVGFMSRERIALEQEIELRRERLALTSTKISRERSAEATAASVAEWQQGVAQIGQSLSDQLMEGGRNFADYLKNLGRTLVFKPVIQWAVQGSGAEALNAMGLPGNAMMGINAGGGMTNSLLNNTGLLGSGAQALWGLSAGASVSSMAAANAVGLAGGDALGALIAGNGGWAGVSAAGGAAASSGAAGFGSIMSGISAAAPWIAGAAALIGLISKFDDSGTPHMGGSAMWSAATGGKTNLDLLNTSKTDNPLSNIDNQFGSGFGWVEDRAEVRDVLGVLAQGMGSSLDSFAKSFGSAFGYEVALGFADDTSKDGSWGALRISQGGHDIVNWNDNRESKWAPRSFSDGEEGYKQYLNAVFLDYKTALLGMDLPAWADQILDASSDIDTINAALQQIGATRLIFDQLGQSMQMFSGISGDLQTQLLMASGGIESLSANAGTFYQGFFDESERMEALNQQLRDTLTGLDLSIDPAMGEAAKRQYREAVEAAMAGGQGELAAQLLAMSGTFATAADYAQQAADEAQKAADALGKTMADLLSERRNLSAEYLRASGDAEGYAEALRSMATEGYTEAERAAWDYNEALRSQIAAFDEAAQLQQSLAEITGQTAQSVQGVLEELLGRVQATSAFRASLGQSIESARLGTMGLSSQADYLRGKESGLWSQLDSAADPLAVAEQLQQTILDRISVESQLREQLDGQTLSALQQQLSVAQSLQSAALSMQNTVDGLRLGNTSALNPYAQLQYAGSKFDDAYARALAGDLDAWKDVQSFGQSYVGLGRDVFASSTDSADIFFKVTEAMDQLVALGLDADPQITALNAQIELLQTVGENTEQQTWASQQQLQAFERLDSVMQRQQLQQQQQADKQLALAQQQIEELRKHNDLLQAQINQQAQISAEQKQRDAKLIAAAEKSAEAARMAEAQT